MGYAGNHLATISTGAFAAVLTGLWPYFMSFAPVLDFVFIMAVPITWFLTFTCWIAQKSADYMHEHAPAHQERQQTINVAADGSSTVVLTDIRQIQHELSSELESLKEAVKLKDDEIVELKTKITNLQTMVQIESLKAELANLRALASKE